MRQELPTFQWMHGKLLYENTNAWDIKDWPVWSKTQGNLKAFPYQDTGYPGLGNPIPTMGEAPGGLWLVTPIGITRGAADPHQKLTFCVKKMHFRRAETQEDMSRGMLESWGGVHNKHKTVLDRDHPASPRVPALASKLSVSNIPCAWSLPFCLFPSHHHWTKPNHTREQRFGKELLHRCRAGCGPTPILINFIHKTWIYSMQFFGTLSNTVQNYISVIRGKD